MHLGHLAGPFLSSDVFARYQRLKGHDVLFISYADDYQSYVTKKSKQENITSEETANKYTKSIEETLLLADIQIDHFMKPRLTRHYRLEANQLLSKLLKENAIKFEKTKTFFCEKCESYRYEGLTNGNCHHCGSESDANYCESCCFPQNPASLQNAICTGCGDNLKIEEANRIMFLLSNFENELREYYSNKNWRPRLMNFCKDMLEKGLPNTGISRITNWGIPIDNEQFKNHCLDTWFGGLPGYIAATKDWIDKKNNNKKWEDYWSNNVEFVQFLGIDCAFSHAVLYPRMLIATKEYPLPDTIITNELYRLENNKFSTSKNHAIWGSDILKAVQSDSLRFYLAYTAPETESTNFSIIEFQKFVNEELYGKINGWIQEFLNRWNLIPLSIDSCVELIKSNEKYDKIEYQIKFVQRAYQSINFSLRNITEGLLSLINIGVESMNSENNEKENVIISLYILKTLLELVAPIMPKFSDALNKLFKSNINNHQINGNFPYFQKVTDDVVSMFLFEELSS